MANYPQNNNGQATNANSSPVTISSDQVFPAGFLRTTDEPRQIFYDPFDAALDTTNMWTSGSGNSGVAPATSAGTLTIGSGTVASGYSKLSSIPTFKPVVPAWIGFSFAIALPDGAAPTANAYRFWGAATLPAVPTTVAPITDGVGFELTTAGKLQAVVWAAGVRTLIADLSSTGTNTQPLDASMHRYIVYVRTDKAFFYIDGLTAGNLVATSNFQAPSIQTLPISMEAIGFSTPPATNTQIQCSGLAVWDTGKNATQIADGIFPFRKAQVSAANALKVDGSGTTQPVQGAGLTSTTGNITLSGAANAISLNVANAGNCTISVHGTYVQNFTFEASDDSGTTWYPISGSRMEGIYSEQVTGLLTNVLRAWDFGCSGITNIRVYASAVTSGTAVIKISAGTFPHEPAPTVTGFVGLNAGTNVIGKTGIDQTTDGTTNAVRLLAETTKVIGTVNNAVGANIIGKVGIDQTTLGTTNAVQTIPGTIGGLSTFHLVSAATTNLTNIKNAAGMVYGWYIYNSNAAARKVAFHNLSTTPVAGASIFMTLVIPPTSGANVQLGMGIAFSAGIGISTVTGLTDADTTAVALNDLVINIFYK